MKAFQLTNPEEFVVLWSGLSGAGGYTGRQVDQIVRVLDVLESISEELLPDVGELRRVLNDPQWARVAPSQVVETIEGLAAGMRIGRRLKPGGGEILLEDADHQLVLDRLESLSWTLQAARRAKRLLDRLRQAA